MAQLPSQVERLFPIIFQQWCGVTLRLYDYIITGIYQGQDFLELSEGLAAMNYRALMKNNPDNPNFDNDIFCAYPRNDKLMNLSLEQFQIMEDLYECDMNKRVGKILSCDHTFKTSKHVAVTGEDDGKFVCQYQNIFLGLNENGEVLTCRITKSTASSEIEDLLKELITRFDRVGVPLEMIIVDDCCHVTNLYERIFPEVKIRLDLFHACSRILQSISKKDS